MEYRQLGDSGLTVSVVGLGCNNFGRRVDKDDTRAVVDACFDAGITFFDTADIYFGDYGYSEEFLGDALEGRRDDVVIATKFGMDMHGRLGVDWGVRGSRRYIRKAVEASLRRLRTDWIDLYQYHEPDGITPLEETLAALDDLVREGKVRYIGASNFAGWQVMDADWTARTAGTQRFISVQNRYSLLDRRLETEVTPACEQLGVGILPFFPLENGLLTGKYRRGEPAPAGTRLHSVPERLRQEAFDAIEGLNALADERGVSLLDVAIGGLAAQPMVGSVIAGATKPEQVAANAKAGLWQPTDEDLAAIDAIVPSGTQH